MRTRNLVVRRSGFFFRISVPIHLRKMVGLTEIMRQIRTTDLNEASSFCNLLSGKFKALFHRIEENPVTEMEFRSIIKDNFQELLEKTKSSRLSKPYDSPEECEQDVEELEGQLSDHRDAIASNQFLLYSSAVDKMLGGAWPDRFFPADACR